MVDDLRQLYPAPAGRSLTKEIDHIDHHCARFIGLSPFCVLSTVRGGGADLSPRGGDPGWVTVADERTLVLPDRPGNNRLDSLTNLAAADGVALLFLVPGIDETLRVYGRATVEALDDDRRAGLGVDHRSRSALRVGVDRAFFHCAKALMRSHLWDPDRRVDRSSFPTMAELMRDHGQRTEPLESQEDMVRRYRPEL